MLGLVLSMVQAEQGYVGFGIGVVRQGLGEAQSGRATGTAESGVGKAFGEAWFGNGGAMFSGVACWCSRAELR
jgi:hypothetical protein